MATFTYTPSPGTRKIPQARIKELQFGKGYSQRAGDGINNIAETWNVILAVRNNTDANAIEAFFEARAGHESFDWTPPGGLAAKYTCKTWPRTFSQSLNTEVINATFERVYEA